MPPTWPSPHKKWHNTKHESSFGLASSAQVLNTLSRTNLDVSVDVSLAVQELESQQGAVADARKHSFVRAAPSVHDVLEIDPRGVRGRVSECVCVCEIERERGEREWQ
jgi:hypothetical protein